MKLSNVNDLNADDCPSLEDGETGLVSTGLLISEGLLVIGADVTRFNGDVSGIGALNGDALISLAAVGVF